MVRITLEIQQLRPGSRQITGGVTHRIDPLPAEDELAGIVRQLLTEFLPAALAQQGLTLTCEFEPDFPK
jgi:hypothetical protein